MRNYIRITDIAKGYLIALEKQLLENNNIEFINFDAGKCTSILALIRNFE
tara:strand:+ start:630 stop:779 length:150 start_codon:yes stop_codon:yes gene_type:complete